MIAQVKQATSFDPNRKPVLSGEDGWVIRNISFPYRVAPIKEDRQMYEIQPRDSDTVLANGRYALVEGDYAYDFTVNGTVTDKHNAWSESPQPTALSVRSATSAEPGAMRWDTKFTSSKRADRSCAERLNTSTWLLAAGSPFERSSRPLERSGWTNSR